MNMQLENLKDFIKENYPEYVDITKSWYEITIEIIKDLEKGELNG